MRLGESANKKTTKIVRGVLGALALFFILAFAKEIWGVLGLFWTVIKVVVLAFPFEGSDRAILDSFNIIVYNCLIGFGLVFLVWLLLISAQALLPVNNPQEIYRTAWHLWLYITRRHGQAIFIQDGVEISTHEDIERRGHGVIVVDFNSAVVLEERDVPPGLTRLMSTAGINLLNTLSLSDPPISPRVCGPGIVFTRPGERIRGVVDLRMQFRVQPRVTCYTREGIELYANVWSAFTIGLDPEPDALQVTYAGEHQAEFLRVCAFTPLPGRGGKFLKLAALKDELDAPDRSEIHNAASSAAPPLELYPYHPLPRHPGLPVFDPKRVFGAIFAQAQTSNQEILPWTELPTRVAAGFFRELLPTINYDQLYDIHSGGSFPLPEIKSKLRLAMRNNGVLAYRLVYHVHGEPLIEGRDYHESELAVSAIYPLSNPKMLRDRGIKVQASGFGDLIPVSPLIYKQRLDTWRARWERELDLTTAGRELQAMRVRSRALANAQQDLWHTLHQILSASEYTDEALALRLMQALEAAAADPKTRELLPVNTMDMLRHMNSLLAPVNTPGSPPKPTPLPKGNR